MKNLLFALALLLAMTTAGVTAAMDYVEAPMLAERVAAGELPPVEERLPQNPVVIGPGSLIGVDHLDWQVGRHGGTIRSVHLNPNYCGQIFMNINETLLRAPGIGALDIKPNIVEEFSVSEDNTEFTFRLREGLRWSDGHPVTTEDVRFAWGDVLLNTYITPAVPRKFRSGGSTDHEPLQLEIIDEYTFRFVSMVPYGYLITNLTIEGWAPYGEIIKPKHYLSQFHADYTPLEEMRDALREQELDDEWWRLFAHHDVFGGALTSVRAIGMPVLTPWMRVESPGGTMVYERNPFFFKVDVEGNQLPYVDTLWSEEVGDHEMVTIKTISGEVDLIAQYSRLVNLPMYQEFHESGSYDVHFLDMHTVSSVIYPNHNYPDAGWQEVIGDVRFRQAVSLAVDRDELISTLYYGQASYVDPMLIPEEFSAHDPERAELLLDSLGMAARDADGYRLSPSGEPLELYFEVFGRNPDIVPGTELLVEHLKEVGLRATMRQISGELRGQRASANELQLSVEYSAVPRMRLGTMVVHMLPDAWTQWGPLWARYYATDGREGEQPPLWVQELYSVFDTIQASAPGTPEADAAWTNLFLWYSEHLPFIFTVDYVGHPFLASKQLRNIPHGGFNIAAEYSAQQFFYAE